MHWKKGCWFNDTGKAKGMDVGTPKGTTKGGASGSTTNDVTQQVCWTCNQPGYKASACPKKPPSGGEVHALEAEPEPTGELTCLFMYALETSRPLLNRSTKVRFGIDSGAAVSVIPECVCADYSFQTTEGTGNVYHAAGGHIIADLGSRTLYAEVDGQFKGLRPRVGKIQKPLLSTYDLCRAGHRVVFDMENGVGKPYAEHKETGQRTRSHLRKRVWELDVQVMPHANLKQVMSKASAKAPDDPFVGRATWP